LCFVSDTLICFQQLISAAHCSLYLAQYADFVGCLDEKWLSDIFIISLDIWQFPTFFPFTFHSLPWCLTVSDCNKMSCSWLAVVIPDLFTVLTSSHSEMIGQLTKGSFFSLLYNSHLNNDLSFTVHWEPIASCEFQF
jgi:hypothetical protein